MNYQFLIPAIIMAFFLGLLAWIQKRWGKDGHDEHRFDDDPPAFWRNPPVSPDTNAAPPVEPARDAPAAQAEKRSS